MDREGRAIEARDAIRGWSRQEAYHEVIVSPSIDEVRAASDRHGGDDRKAAQETALRLAREIAQGRDFYVAIHWDSEASKIEAASLKAQRDLRELDARHRRWGTIGTDYHHADRQRILDGLAERMNRLSAIDSDRWHFHLVIRGPIRERLFGEQGRVQRAWDRLWNDRPDRIRDWDAHLRFQALREEVREVQRQQRILGRERSEAIRKARSSEKAMAAHPYEERMLDLIHRRFALEAQAIEARYAARGTAGGAEHCVEVQKSEQRRDQALKRLRLRCESRGDRTAPSRSRTIARVVEVAPRVLDGVLLAAQAGPEPPDRSGLVAARAAAQILVGVLRERRSRGR
jgi:hypothetical protein